MAKIHKLDVVSEGKFIRFIKSEEWEYVERSNCTGIVAIIPVTDDKKLVLIEQYRVPVGKKVIEFPAGLVNDKKLSRPEKMITAAKRELLEETGYKAGRIIKIFEGPLSSGITSEMMTFYLATRLKKVSSGGGDMTEDIKVHHVPLAKIDTWLKARRAGGCLVDPKLYGGLYFITKYLNA